MNPYWDSSVIIEATLNPGLLGPIQSLRPWCRPHVLAESFSTLTGGRLGFRVDPDQASAILSKLAVHLRFVELTGEETLAALAMAKGLGIRGGRIHDFLHVAAARKAGCTTLVTLNLADFTGIDPQLTIESP